MSSNATMEPTSERPAMSTILYGLLSQLPLVGRMGAASQ